MEKEYRAKLREPRVLPSPTVNGGNTGCLEKRHSRQHSEEGSSELPTSDANLQPEEIPKDQNGDPSDTDDKQETQEPLCDSASGADHTDSAADERHDCDENTSLVGQEAQNSCQSAPLNESESTRL